MSSTRRPIVLLVQQSRDDGLEMYATFLRRFGLATITVSNAGDALTVASGADIVVTGINLDDQVDGIELVSCLRRDRRTRHTPIIVLSTCAWRSERERAADAGCDIFLPKPCLPTDLLREVRLMLRHRGGHHGTSPSATEQYQAAYGAL